MSDFEAGNQLIEERSLNLSNNARGACLRPYKALFSLHTKLGLEVFRVLRVDFFFYGATREDVVGI